jgi:acetyltransferase-like isoleucine patch superfamily enzyme
MKAIKKLITDIVCSLPDISSLSILKVRILNLWEGIEIEKGVRIGNGVKIVGNVKIGSGTSIGPYSFLSSGNGTISIGENVMIAPKVSLISFNHGIKRGELKKHQELIACKIRIEDDVWVGINSVVVGNSTLKKGSVLGAHSLLIGTTKEYGVYVGSPAKLIKEL